MMLRLKTLIGCLLLSSLVACGGGSGGGLEREPTTGGGTGGGTETTTERSIVLSLTDASGTASKELSSENPLTLTAVVKDANGNDLNDILVTFTFAPTGLANFTNDSGTATTGTTGIATIGLTVAENSGAGEIVATISSGESKTITYNSAGITEQNEQPASLDFFASSFQLASSGSDEIELIALVKNTQSILVSGVPVSFSAAVGDDATIQITQGITGPDGTARALLTTQNKPRNRTIKVTASAGTLTQNLNIQVVGTQVILNSDPSVVVGGSAEVTILLADSDGNGIPNQSLSLTSQNANTFSNANPTTDETGQVSVIYNANNSGVDVISASALNAVGTQNISIQEDKFEFSAVPTKDIPLGELATLVLDWSKDGNAFVGGNVSFNTTRGTLTSANGVTDANGQVSVSISSNNAGQATISAQGVDANGNIVNTRQVVEFIATDVDNIIISASPNAIGPNGQKSTITAVIRNPQGNLVKGKTVNFSANDVSGGRISPATSVTDSNGIASTVYTSSAVTTENGVTITATEVESSIAASTKITVNGRAQFISIGTGNSIQIPDETSYLKTFTVFVTDANSNPVKNINLTVTGTPVKSNEFLDPQAQLGDANYQLIKPAFYKGYWRAYPDPNAFEYWVPETTIGCSNEDKDDDAIEDPNEDTNGDNELTPGNIVSIDGNVTTDDNGQALIELRYAKTYAAWGVIKITVSTPVAGSESQASQYYRLAAATSDLEIETTPPNTNPFGSGVNMVEDPNNPGNLFDDGANRTCSNTL
ncbi:Ig-like domain-containing protein [Paraglaciecola hydrolytica]|uniref:Big-1 domain-containing protein n=1 Tax=Paraglaciecola hydrolytica TaxID=1799789 RepID=A0A136A662_9ALTE|nr:Ig-like domain-containing protein [Paraglaciecola hydrolytica]KXI30701.1 hypothetical protein AX660_04545 [Paraglaciecola hydrolytica]